MRRTTITAVLLAFLLVLVGLAGGGLAGLPVAGAVEPAPVPPAASCPELVPLAYGTGPTDVRAGVFCRRFEATQGQSFYVRSAWAAAAQPGATARGYPPTTRVYDSAGELVCANVFLGPSGEGDPNQASCDHLAAGTYVVVASPRPADPDDVLLGLYDKTSSAGCVPLPTGFALATRVVAPGQLDCWTMPDTTDGFVGFARPTTDRFETWWYFLLDETGAADYSCYFSQSEGAAGCRAPTTGEHRLVGGEMYRSSPAHPQTVTGFVTEDLLGCVRIAPGTTVVPLSAASPATCVYYPDLRFTHAARVEVAATTGSGFVLKPSDPAAPGGASCGSGSSLYRTVATVGCRGRIDVRQALSVSVLVGDGSDQQVSFRRTDAEIQGVRLVNRAGPGVFRSGSLTPIRTARVGDRLRAGHGAWAPVAHDYAWQWFSGGRPIAAATSPYFTVRRRFVGRPLVVRVIASDTYYHLPGTAYSRQIKIRS